MIGFGYHYTSLDNYRKIQETGLIPYRIDKPDLATFFPDGITGVWLWTAELTGNEHSGSVLWQVMTKSSTQIVKLRVYYHDVLKYYGTPVEVLHDGRLGSWNYHSRVPAVISPSAIPPGNILLVNTYDLHDLLRDGEPNGRIS